MRLIGMHLVGENIIVVGCEEFRFSKFGKLYPTVPLSGCCGSSYRGWLASALHLPTGSKTRTATSSSLRIPEHVTRFKQQLLTRPPSQILCSATRHIVMALD